MVEAGITSRFNMRRYTPQDIVNLIEEDLGKSSTPNYFRIVQDYLSRRVKELQEEGEDNPYPYALGEAGAHMSNLLYALDRIKIYVDDEHVIDIIDQAIEKYTK